MKNKSLELLRGIAAFGIVACHLQLAGISSAGWKVRALCDMNVGLFAALSGFLMWKGGDAEPWAVYARKRCSRLLPTYFIWTLGYVIFGFCFDLLVRHGINPKWSAGSYIPHVIFRGDASTHLWFIISLLYVQLVFYSFARSVRGLSAIVLSFAGIVFLGFYHKGWYAHYPLRVFAFLVGGYGVRALMGNQVLPAARKSMIWFGVAAIGVVAHYSLRAPIFIRDWLVAMPLLVAFAYLSIKSDKVNCIVEWLGATSMGVFLIHPVITAANLLWVSKIFSSPYGPVAVLTDWIVSWLIAIIIASIAVRIAWMRRWWV